jgi:SAM-dependent methyltransferase
VPDVLAAEHPAKWSESVLVAIAEVVGAEVRRVGHSLEVLDPFAGIGRGRLAEALGPSAELVIGIELQPEWLADPGTFRGDATHLEPGWTGRFDAVISSPCYGNRLSDHHDAKDPCKVCGGSRIDVAGRDRPCSPCKGTGLSWRNTYAHALRRQGGDLVPGSAAGMAWGREYRMLHRDALNEMVRVTKPGGLLVINMSNHPKTVVKGEPAVEQQVVEWWVNRVIVAGCFLRAVLPVETPRYRNGANAHAKRDEAGDIVGPDPRAANEVLIVAHTPNPRRPA